jgi:hypothetical protein
VTRYRFLDPMGDEIADHEFGDHATALAWAHGDVDDGPDLPDEEIHRVEYLGPGGDWRWAGAMRG